MYLHCVFTIKKFWRNTADSVEQTAKFMAFVLHCDIICISLRKMT